MRRLQSVKRLFPDQNIRKKLCCFWFVSNIRGWVYYWRRHYFSDICISIKNIQKYYYIVYWRTTDIVNLYFNLNLLVRESPENIKWIGWKTVDGTNLTGKSRGFLQKWTPPSSFDHLVNTGSVWIWIWCRSRLCDLYKLFKKLGKKCNTQFNCKKKKRSELMHDK